jgi:hypothetical protein
MSLRKSPTLTPARLQANRSNARKSTGPRTARGKAQSRLNSLRKGRRSALHRKFVELMLWAPPCSVDRTAQALLTPEQAAHALFAEMVEMFRHAETMTGIVCVDLPRWLASGQKKIPPENIRAKPECY